MFIIDLFKLINVIFYFILKELDGAVLVVVQFKLKEVIFKWSLLSLLQLFKFILINLFFLFF
jgi:hypothetical protein